MTYIALILSVLVGILIVFGFKPGQKSIQLLLAFSGAYLLSITTLHLFPEVYETHSHHVGVFILIGLLFQIILDFFSKGAEHGHVHIHEGDNLFPWALFLSLCVHAFLEGIPLGHSHNHEYLLWAIVIHNVPISIILGTFFMKSKISKNNAILFMLLFSFMSPLGSLAGEHLEFLVNYKTEITAIIIGIFLHISTIILFETSKDHKFNLLKFISIIVGMVIAYLA